MSNLMGLCMQSFIFPTCGKYGQNLNYQRFKRWTDRVRACSTPTTSNALGLCLRVIMNEKHKHLEKTTSSVLSGILINLCLIFTEQQLWHNLEYLLEVRTWEVYKGLYYKGMHPQGMPLPGYATPSMGMHPPQGMHSPMGMHPPWLATLCTRPGYSPHVKLTTTKYILSLFFSHILIFWYFDQNPLKKLKRLYNL